MGSDRIAVYRLALFQRVIDRGEFGVDPGAKTIHHSDDGERNTGSDQSVFGCRGAGLVSDKILQQIFHQLGFLFISEKTR